jgi:hypothetical protein
MNTIKALAIFATANAGLAIVASEALARSSWG